MTAIDEFHTCEVKPITTVASASQSFMKTIEDEDEENEVERHTADDEQIQEISNSLDSISDVVKAHLTQIKQEKSTLEKEDEQADADID